MLLDLQNSELLKIVSHFGFHVRLIKPQMVNVTNVMTENLVANRCDDPITISVSFKVKDSVGIDPSVKIHVSKL